MPYLPMPFPAPGMPLETQGFWDGCKRHELVIQRCTECGWYRHFPRPTCPKCRSFSYEWTRMSGKGRVDYFTIVRRPLFPGMPVPYNIVHVRLPEQEDIVLLGNLIDSEPEEIHVGMPVEMTFEDINPDFTMYYWKKAA